MCTSLWSSTNETTNKSNDFNFNVPQVSFFVFFQSILILQNIDEINNPKIKIIVFIFTIQFFDKKFILKIIF